MTKLNFIEMSSDNSFQATLTIHSNKRKEYNSSKQIFYVTDLQNWIDRTSFDISIRFCGLWENAIEFNVDTDGNYVSSCKNYSLKMYTMTPENEKVANIVIVINKQKNDTESNYVVCR